MQPAELLAKRRRNFARELQSKRWYHSIPLRDGRVIEGLISIDRLRQRADEVPIARDLRGKRVLDIGAWDGFFSFEMERRGASVMAVDCVEVENFRRAHKLLGSRVEYREFDLFELTPERVGRFDIVLFLGVLYHLKHPLLGLERVCALTREIAIVESFIAEDLDTTIPAMEFYETGELGEQLDNWFGPTVPCLMALCRTAGFARVELVSVRDERACVACYRQWAPHEPRGPAPRLLHAVHNRDYGRNFYSFRAEYVTCRFETQSVGLTRADVFPEVSGLGVVPILVRHAGECQWAAVFRLPLGLEQGSHNVRLRVRESEWSNAASIVVDVAASPSKLEIGGLCDGLRWTPGEVALGPEAYLSIWVRGLPENADCGNLRAYLAGERQTFHFLGDQADGNGYRQFNIRLQADTEAGEWPLVVRCGAVESAPVTVRVLKTGAFSDQRSAFSS